MITVLRAGPLTTVQDLGRPGYAHLGVPRSGALDGPALVRANRLVGNPPEAAGLETTLMGCKLRFEEAVTVAVTGAPAVVKVDKAVVDGPVVEVPAGAVLEIGRAAAGVRSYLAVAGGIAVEPVLGSRSTDTLSGLGPDRLTDGMTLPVGAASGSDREDPGAPAGYDGELVLGVRLGPRDDWFDVAGLFGYSYQISPMSNRVGARLAGTALTRAKAGELPSEGVVLGAVQVPADGQPIIFLADHPTTGGYPVIGVVDDVTPLAQARPGTTVRFRDLD
ncbi:5-oxoprolinase subunit C family protein [Actinoplanes aureus]|uniref:Biotin-dependent carboxyltransferase family protein n=1 Tax=Actinoplanes aureus TaxID=2792083 RepID=A0A931C3N3_9ACTN|nr:biotin-dependent carboxyltransferase family protein [Actinoplanes aureus]MBG0560496.1 biotin-dependent carboxyltransferase family protein [Actinoplanes aureus]